MQHIDLQVEEEKSDKVEQVYEVDWTETHNNRETQEQIMMVGNKQYIRSDRSLLD